MDRIVEERVRALAQPLWESAARPYGMAMDFWLMAEQMVMEMMAASARMHSTMLGVQPTPPKDAPREMQEVMPVAQVRALAQCMWESAGRQYEMAQDFWLAAERHILAMVRAAGVSDASPLVQELSSLAPSAYLERMRASAYYLWEAAGRQYGQALEFWLTAERQTLATLTEAYAPPADVAPPRPTTPAAASEGAPTDATGGAQLPMVEDAVATPVDAPAATNVTLAADTPAAPAPEKGQARKRAARPRSPVTATSGDGAQST